MADITKHNVKTYIRDLIKEEFNPNNKEEKRHSNNRTSKPVERSHEPVDPAPSGTTQLGDKL